ncbi:MAG: alpha/beta hydrolase [Phycisphaerae bacterium]|nr:alpha/beta hydrolase [Phycisphaerae bacterium]
MTRARLSIKIATMMALTVASASCDVLEQLILRPSDNIRNTPADFGYEAEKLALPMADGTLISIWHCKTPAATRKGIIVVVPGNDANKGRYTAGLPLFSDFGWDMILMDYPGFGESTGTKSLQGLIDSTFVVTDYAMSKADVVVGYGISMGAPVLMRVAAERDFAAVMFESILDLWGEGSGFIEHHLGGIPGIDDSPFVSAIDLVAIAGSPEAFDTKRWAALVEEPKLFIHSPEDNVTPFQTMWEVYKRAPQPKHVFVTEGDHALQIFLDPVLYRETINGWLTGVLSPDPILNEKFQEILQIEIQAALDELGL